MKEQVTKVLLHITLLFILLLSGCGTGTDSTMEQRVSEDFNRRNVSSITNRELPANFLSQKRFEGKGRVVYLTFDDGPTENTKEVLSVLREHNAKATFFVNGRESDFAKDMYQAIVAEGHTLGNHTYTHEYENIYSDLDRFKEDFFQLQELLEDTTGNAPKYFRFPGGSNSSRANQYGGEAVLREIRQFLEENGYVFFDWNVDSQDSATQHQSKEVIIKETLKQLRNKDRAIVIFHDGYNKESTVEALPEILNQLEDWGFTFEPLSKRAPKKHFRL